VAGAAAAAEGESGDVERIRDEDEDGRRDVGRSANMAGRKTAQTGLCSDIRPPPRNLTDIYPGKSPPPIIPFWTSPSLTVWTTEL